MGEYNEKTGVNLVERFWVIDPITEATSPGDPDDVYFHIVDPNEIETVYHWPGDAEISHPVTGAFVLEIEGGFLAPGIYRYWVEGIGSVDAVSNVKTFTILAGGDVGDQEFSSVPIAGPCQSWISGDDINACGPDLGLGSESWRLDDAAADASALLYVLSGRQFAGVCERTVRPCASPCAHWTYGSPWPSGWSGATGWGFAFDNFLGYWRDFRGDRCGCNALSEVRLAGYPVRRIVEVKIDGVVLAATDSDGLRNYRLDQHRKLIRMDGLAGRRFWPGCQNMALDPDQPGTFAVTYEWGIEPPNHGKLAAAQLGRELWNACDPDATCQLPSGVVQIIRQGVTINRVSALADLLREGGTGIQLVDTFIATANPTKMRRRPLIFSPDVQPFARRTG